MTYTNDENFIADWGLRLGDGTLIPVNGDLQQCVWLVGISEQVWPELPVAIVELKEEN